MKGVLSVILMASSASAFETREEMIQGCRQEIIKSSVLNDRKIFSPIERNDLAEELVDEPDKMIRLPREMETRGLLSGHSKETPWSDSYWPMYRGGLGQRYNDPDFKGYEWKEASDYVKARSASELIRDQKFDFLSPSEKYDFLLGLTKFPLTASQWKDGQEYFVRSGKVESWMGLCHGWAPASMMMPEPRKKVSNGELTFYPSDIKALATLAWAKGQFPTRFIGGRCNTQNPDSGESNRVEEQECLDNNPGSWHLVVVNQLGISRRPFIMDASYDYQVWNHPVFSYDYTYFNPKSGKKGKFKDSVENSGTWDQRRKFRSRDAKAIIGVKMIVTYAIENEPSLQENQPSESASAHYEYDLELNQNGEIIGGEWISESHPDFLWLPVPGSFPETPGDQAVVNLSGISREVREIGRAGAQRGLPVGAVVKALVSASKELP